MQVSQNLLQSSRNLQKVRVLFISFPSDGCCKKSINRAVKHNLYLVSWNHFTNNHVWLTFYKALCPRMILGMLDWNVVQGLILVQVRNNNKWSSVTNRTQMWFIWLPSDHCGTFHPANIFFVRSTKYFLIVRNKHSVTRWKNNIISYSLVLRLVYNLSLRRQ